MTKRSFRDLWATSSDGRRLHARSYGDDEARTPPIVCLPGLARNAADFHDLAMALTDPDDEPPRHVVAVDYRGRGQSDHDPDPANYSVPVETQDLLTLLDRYDVKRPILIGSSRGGIIAMAVAAGRPGYVRAAVLNDIGPVIERAGLLRIKGYVGKLREPRDLDEAAGLIEGLFGQQFPELRDRDWKRWAANTWSDRTGKLVLSYDPALARTLDPIGPDAELPNLWPMFEALKSVPVLVVRGANSDLLSAETVEEMRGAHPDLDVLTVIDQGHTPLLETPDVLSQVRRFVARVERLAAAD